MTSSFLWKHISQDQVKELTLMTDPDALKNQLALYLGLLPAAGAGPGLGPQAAGQVMVLVNLHFHNFAFCKEQRFTPPQTSTFMSIFKTVVDDDRKQVALGDTLNQSFQRFEALLLMHSVERSPVSVGVFGPEEVQAIVDYALNGYYRHFKLYEYVFQERVHMVLEQVALNMVEAPQAPQPLEEAILVESTNM